MISDKTIPPLQTSEPLDQADAEADKANDNEHENKRVIGDSTDKGTDPGDGTSDNRTNVTNDSSERTGGRSTRR